MSAVECPLSNICRQMSMKYLPSNVHETDKKTLQNQFYNLLPKNFNLEKLNTNHSQMSTDKWTFLTVSSWHKSNPGCTHSWLLTIYIKLFSLRNFRVTSGPKTDE